ncbi:MAG: hypothetical protein K6E38_03405 [Fretibacterium sp.]|nr:hypothetical protein [Fretibacterium sp.]
MSDEKNYSSVRFDTRFGRRGMGGYVAVPLVRTQAVIAETTGPDEQLQEKSLGQTS